MRKERGLEDKPDSTGRRDALKAATLPVAAALLSSCEGNPVTVSPPPPIDTDPDPPPVLPPPFPDYEPEVPYRCLTAFALNIRSEGEIGAFCMDAREKGYNMVRVGSETVDWNEGFFGMLKGPEPGSPGMWNPEWEDGLIAMLERTLRVPIAVELCVIFTVKGRSVSYQKEYARRVGEIASQYPHVVLSACNEPIHPSSVLDRRSTNDLLRLLRPFAKWLTVDDGGINWRFDRSLVDFVAIHPDRNPEPNRDELSAMMSRWGRVFFDETVSYASDEDLAMWPEFVGRAVIAQFGHGTEAERKAQVERHIKDIIATGGEPCAHGLRLIEARTPFWAPVLR